MITLERAEEMFAQMVIDSGENYQIDAVWEIEYDDPIYVMTVIDGEGKQHLPGYPFRSIRKRDGALIDYQFPCPA